MPKQTFYNLPEDKKDKIVKAGIDEFSENGYKGSSINSIVADAGISKGSFYQYFDDKKDLFKYICGLAAQEKFKYLDGVIDPELDFFDVYKRMYSAGIRFGLEHPEYYKISNDLMNDSELMKEIFNEQLDKADGFLRSFVEFGIEKGDLRDDIDIDFVSSMMTSLSISMGEYFMKRYTYEEFTKLELYAEKYIDLIKNGIARRHSDD